MSENKVELAMKQESDMSTETTPIEVGTAWTMAQRLREEELAVIDDEDRDAEDFLKNGALIARSSGMAPIRNACGDCLLAKVEVAEDGKRSIVFAQKHDDGTVSASMRIGQVELFRYIQCLARKDRGNAEEQRQNRTRARKIRGAVEDEYFSRHSSGEILDIDEILAALAAACSSLPIEKKVASGISDDELYVIANTFFDGRAEGWLPRRVVHCGAKKLLSTGRYSTGSIYVLSQGTARHTYAEAGVFAKNESRRLFVLRLLIGWLPGQNPSSER